MSTETIRLITNIRDGGKGVWKWGKRESIYNIYRYTVTSRMTCSKMGSDESHFNVSLTVRDKVTSVYKLQLQEKGEQKRYRTEVLLLTSLPPYH